ncbi:CCA tRNA nucleotidyltransferase [Pelobacter sp. M08fum]|uniref:Poly(A) polymerase I n=1 Tax=Pelovirga terrestris TaxID=2771352 RepID=A0A8J6UIS1_9BACT|nr:CCA tRNA nucleotidyltransferase [Pelovirga terrestris]MBD1401595.1 CCA tRNA nucleotidyltransferase [Pelovirga terrestris]
MASDLPIILARDQHPISRRQVDEDCLKVLYRLHRNGFKSYLVGGSVRDLLLGRTPKDFDIGTDATPNQIKRLFRNCFLVGRRFRLAHIRFAGNKVIEVATFRREVSPEELPDDPSDHLHFVQNLFGTPGEDAFRRDFTINALFYNIADFSVIDHVDGLADLQQRLIRVIGDPLVRFVEDPVRMLRAIEFAARLDFKLCDDIFPAIEQHRELLATAAPARIREEIMALFRYGIAAPVLHQCRELGMLPHLLAGYPGTDEGISMLAQVDARTHSGIIIDESFALAALYLRLFMDSCPPGRSTPMTTALQSANEILTPHCRYFSIAAGIRLQARDLLIGCFRLVRGRGQRGEQKFLRHPATATAMELFTLWTQVRPDLLPLLQEWNSAISTCGKPVEAPVRRKRRRRKKKPAPLI